MIWPAELLTCCVVCTRSPWPEAARGADPNSREAKALSARNKAKARVNAKKADRRAALIASEPRPACSSHSQLSQQPAPAGQEPAASDAAGKRQAAKEKVAAQMAARRAEAAEVTAESDAAPDDGPAPPEGDIFAGDLGDLGADAWDERLEAAAEGSGLSPPSKPMELAVSESVRPHPVRVSTCANSCSIAVDCELSLRSLTWEWVVCSRWTWCGRWGPRPRSSRWPSS